MGGLYISTKTQASATACGLCPISITDLGAQTRSGFIIESKDSIYLKKQILHNKYCLQDYRKPAILFSLVEHQNSDIHFRLIH